ncbi:MAG: hypothetical protein IIA41_06530 [SAR324 cluster bacterium]|nr:hypothetical protein [SAR324 cluster bacterium]
MGTAGAGWRAFAAMAVAVTAVSLATGSASAFPPERRRDFGERRPNEYLIIPAVASIPGIGVFVGVISTFSNVGDSGIDLAATLAESIDDTDISVQAFAIREIPLLIPGLTLDYIYANINLGNFQTFLPGRDSPNFTIPITAQFHVQVLEPALRLFKRRFNLIYSLSFFDGFGFDEEGNEFPFRDHDAAGTVLLDLTDDVVDPRAGTRLRYTTTLDAPSRSILGSDKGPDNLLGQDDELTIENYEWVFYIPLSQRLVLVWDNQYFQAKGKEDSGEVVAGGSLPLRGYPANRWRDRFGVFHALEFRYTDPSQIRLDFFLARGILEGIQYALFYEVGQVSPESGGLLYEDMKVSYGAGIRALFDAIVLRLDVATSDEGPQTHLTIDQPF